MMMKVMIYNVRANYQCVCWVYSKPVRHKCTSAFPITVPIDYSCNLYGTGIQAKLGGCTVHYMSLTMKTVVRVSTVTVSGLSSSGYGQVL